MIKFHLDKIFLILNILFFIKCTTPSKEKTFIINDSSLTKNIELDTNKDLTLINIPDKYKIFKDTVNNEFIELEFYETKELKRKSRLIIKDERRNGGFKKYIKEGYSESYYKSGAIHSKEIYRNNYLHGKQIYFYTNNQISAIKYFFDNFPDSTWSLYDSLGNIKKKIYHKNFEIRKIEDFK